MRLMSVAVYRACGLELVLPLCSPFSVRNLNAAGGDVATARQARSGGPDGCWRIRNPGLIRKWSPDPCRYGKKPSVARTAQRRLSDGPDSRALSFG
jgi:hypothetical protein